jgi:nucleoside-diphosphate-sugar epimerase
MTRVLVTGARGFLGQACLAALEPTEVEVHAVSRAVVCRAGSAVVWHAADLLDDRQTVRLVEDVRPTHLLHLAWVTTPGQYWTSPENLDWLAASLRLLRAFARAGGRRFVGAGTCAEYDWTAGGTCHEDDTPRRPATLYGVCKAALWDTVESFARQEGLSAAWGRVFFLYGPGEHPRRLVASLARSLLAGEPALCTAGTQRRDFLHVADAGSAFAALLTADLDGAVNIGSGEPVAVADVARQLGQIARRPDLIRLGAVASSPGEPPVLAADPYRLRAGVGWRPRFDLPSGLADAVGWWAAYPLRQA